MEPRGAGSGRRLGEAELEALAKAAAPVSAAGWRQEPGPLQAFTLRGQEETVHLYASAEVGKGILAALQSAREDIPRLVAEVRRLRAEVEDTQARKREAASSPLPASPPQKKAALEIPDDTPLSLAAPFRVGPKELKAAREDPLIALAVQVAKALQDDAREIERARLIAMAFAAARGDTGGFWAARNQRSTKVKATGPATKK